MGRFVIVIGLIGVALNLMGLFDSALAFARPPHPAPAPLVGVGLPLAGFVLAAIALVQRFRR